MGFKEYVKNMDPESAHTKNLKESSLSRLYKHYLEHDSGTISAYRAI